MSALSSRSEASRSAAIDFLLSGGGLRGCAHRGDFVARGGEPFVVGEGAGLAARRRARPRGLTSSRTCSTRSARARVGFVDRPQVVGAGDQFLVVAGAEDQAGGARHAALVDRDQASRERLRASAAGAPSRRPAGARVALSFAAQLGGPLLAFGEQAGETFLVGRGLRRFALRRSPARSWLARSSAAIEPASSRALASFASSAPDRPPRRPAAPSRAPRRPARRAAPGRRQSATRSFWREPAPRDARG